jgi:SAM-dependent methyltransferase
LDPACGRGEFISRVPASERWAIDQMDSVIELELDGVRAVVGDLFEVELPAKHFDGILLSNTLEHLKTYDDVQRCLQKMRAALRAGGVIAILGPNFRYCAKEYFDCADHVLALTHVSVEEHLYAAGFEIRSTLPRYLPYSFRGWLPPSERLTQLYLRNPWAFRLLGKQFLVMGGT